MIVFWRKKGSDLIFNEGDLRERNAGLVKLSVIPYGFASWYKEDEVEIIKQEALRGEEEI